MNEILKAAQDMLPQMIEDRRTIHRMGGVGFELRQSADYILSELEKQVEPLQKQSEKAKVYLKKKEELKELDVNVFLLENKKLTEQLTEVESKYGIAEEDYNSAAEQYDRIKEEYDRIENCIEGLEQEIEAA